MISTRRGLEALVAIAVVLAILLALDLRRSDEVEDRSLAQGLDVDAVTALTWVRKDAPELHLVREGERWIWIKPVEAIADRGAVANVLATLRAARWHRREAASAAGPTHAVLTISTAMPTTGGRPPEYADLPRRTLSIGPTLAGTEQAWIVDGDHALLVDAWVARALDPDPLSLMMRRPFEAIAQAAWIEIADSRGELRVEGSPRRLATPYVALIKAPIVDELHQSLAALEITSLPVGPAPAGAHPRSALTLRTPAGMVTFSEGCGADPRRVLLSSPAGTGCIDPLAHAAALHAIALLRQMGRDVFESRPAPLEAATVLLTDGSVLDVAKLRIGEHAADPERVTELLAVLAAPAELGDTPPRVVIKGSIIVTDRRGAIVSMELFSGGFLRRPGEGLGLRVPREVAAILERPGSAYRELVPWLEDSLSVVAIRIDTKFSSVRGDVIGEWSHPDRTSQMPFAPPEVAKGIEALVLQLAAPRPIAAGPATFATAHRVVIVVKPPTGDVVERTLELGRKAAAGCPARANGVSLLLPSTVCDGVAALVGR